MSGEFAAIRERHYERTGQSFDTPKGVCAWDGTAWPCDAAQLLALLADTPSVEPREVANLSTTDLPRHGVIEYDDHDEWLTESDAEGAARIVARDVPRWFGRLVEAALRPSVEPLDVERLAEALKEYDAGRLRVPFAPSHVLSPDQSPSRFHRAWAKTLLDYALLPTQASDSPEKP